VQHNITLAGPQAWGGKLGSRLLHFKVFEGFFGLSNMATMVLLIQPIFLKDLDSLRLEIQWCSRLEYFLTTFPAVWFIQRDLKSKVNTLVRIYLAPIGQIDLGLCPDVLALLILAFLANKGVGGV